ncbi:MAG: TonB-dependent receptor plug domain-containing protein, partial [Bacteroidaceae bacterium]|nr:TonB-dependent receptor plug domain-containing protein [Bacteroidaceae bacterium]
MTKFFYNIQRQSLRLSVCALMIASATAAFAQDEAEEQAPERKPAKRGKIEKMYPTVTLHGNIIDLGTKLPLAGVQIQALGNTKYTALSDEEGNFTIKVPKFITSLYVFSPEYLSQQVAINPCDSLSKISIKMLCDKYGKMYDNSTSYTASKRIETESHDATIDGDINKQLNGDVRSITRSGAIENGASMFIRGLNSLNANAQPLIVIDGIEQDMMLDRGALHDGQFMNVLANISPSDIESVEVLKNATALYGARGGNGVILIHTKRGHSMATRIDADIYAGVQLIPSLPTMLNATQYRTYATEMIGSIMAQQNYTKSISFNFLNDDPNGYYYNMYHNDTDWTKETYRRALTQNYNINVQGGDDVGMYNLSLGYMKAQNTAKENDFDRMNIRFNTDIEIIKQIKTKFDLSISRTNSNVF